MATEESKLYELIYDMGAGLVIGKVPIDRLKEQDINARIMKKEMQDQLTANIKNRGQLESLPLLALKDGRLEIISGHHRVKSARAAGIKEIICIIDVSGLSRSKIASKQLAHNAISGFDDPSTLKEICKMLEDVDDMLESYIGKDYIDEPMTKYDKLIAPSLDFGFKNIVFSFLRYQIDDMDMLIKSLESIGPELVGVASYEQCEKFVDALNAYQRFTDIRNIGAAIHAMTAAANKEMSDAGFDPEVEEWTYLSKIFGSNAVPIEASETMKKALKKAEKEGAIEGKEKWKAILIWAENYLNGR